MSFTAHQLHVFRTVARLGSHTRAAEALHLAQPAISAHVAALQGHLGVRLFERAGRSIRLTAAGLEFLSYADRLLSLQEEMQCAARDILALRRGRVRLAASTTAGIYVVPPLLGTFHRLHPGIQVSLGVANRFTVLQHLEAGEIDLGVLGMLEDGGRIVAEPFLPNELIVAAPPAHPLVRRSAANPAVPIPLRDLARVALLVRERGSGTRADTEGIFARAGLRMQISQELGSTGAIKVGVLAGLGLAVLPRQAIALHLETGELTVLPVEGFPARRNWHLVRLATRTLSPAAAALREQLLGSAR